MGSIDWGQVQEVVSQFVTQNKPHVFMVVGKIIQTMIIIVLSLVAIKFGSLGIKKFFNKQKEFKYHLENKRTDTLSTLCISVFKYIVYFISIVTILQSVLEIPATTIITAAGIGGLAIGFGAQSLVKDVITGFFILLEDQFSVGDMISIGDMMGTVEELELRITKIRHFAGDLHIIPNGEIKTVTNHTRGNKGAIVEVSIAYEEDIEEAIAVLNQVCEKANEEIEAIVEGPTVLGVAALADSGVVLRVFGKTIAGQQWATERELRKRIKQAFDKEGIEIPYNRMVIIDKSESYKEEREYANEIRNRTNCRT